MCPALAVEASIAIRVVRDAGGNRPLVGLCGQRARLEVVRNVVDRVLWLVWRMGVSEHDGVLVLAHRATCIGRYGPLARGGDGSGAE